jgi:hypothetical protein
MSLPFTGLVRNSVREQAARMEAAVDAILSHRDHAVEGNHGNNVIFGAEKCYFLLNNWTIPVRISIQHFIIYTD